MSTHRKPNFDELEVGHILKNGNKLLRIIEIDYRRNIVYYEEVGNKKNQGRLTESTYKEQCQGGRIEGLSQPNLHF